MLGVSTLHGMSGVSAGHVVRTVGGQRAVGGAYVHRT